MKAFLAAALLAAAPAIASADYLASNGVDSILLTEKPCPAEIAALVPEEWRDIAQLADASIAGKHYQACYALRSDGIVVGRYLDGDWFAIPLSQFKPAPGI